MFQVSGNTYQYEKNKYEKTFCSFTYGTLFQVSGTYQYETLSVYYTHKHISVTKFVNSNKQPQTIKVVNICLYAYNLLVLSV